MLLVKRADKINETGTGGVDHIAAAVAVTKGKPERRDSEEDRENCTTVYEKRLETRQGEAEWNRAAS